MAEEPYIRPFSMRHFLKETDFKTSELPALFALAREFKRKRGQRNAPAPLQGQTWAMTRQITTNSVYNHTYARRPLNATDPF